MVNTPRAENNKQNPETSLHEELLKEAKSIYQDYCTLHSSTTIRKPLGVVINLKNYRSQLIFSNTPVLLPNELFITLKQLESRT